MKFVKFHDPENNEVWVGHRWVSKIKQPVKGQHSVKARAVVVMGGNEQAVIETIEEALKILEEADGVPQQDDTTSGTTGVTTASYKPDDSRG